MDEPFVSSQSVDLDEIIYLYLQVYTMRKH